VIAEGLARAAAWHGACFPCTARGDGAAPARGKDEARMRSPGYFWLWTFVFFAMAFVLALVAFRVVSVPFSALAPAKILLFGSILLGLMALSNAVHERHVH
jgi:hypothetical protein